MLRTQVFQIQFSEQGAVFLQQINGQWLRRIPFRELKERDLFWFDRDVLADENSMDSVVTDITDPNIN